MNTGGAKRSRVLLRLRFSIDTSLNAVKMMSTRKTHGATMYGLKSYLVREGITQTEFAQRIGITPEYLSRILCGHVAPSDQLRRHIELETQGKVRA